MYLDADVLYALMKEKDFNKGYAERALNMKESKYTSTITLLELEIVVKRELGDALSKDIARWVKRIAPSLKIISFSESHFEKSLELREKYGLGIFDAAHAAVCLATDKRMASTDLIYDRVAGLTRIG